MRDDRAYASAPAPAPAGSVNMQAVFNGFQSTFRNGALTSSVAITSAVFMRGIAGGREKNVLQAVVGVLFVISAFCCFMAADELAGQLRHHRGAVHVRPEWGAWVVLARVYGFLSLTFLVAWALV